MADDLIGRSRRHAPSLGRTRRASLWGEGLSQNNNELLQEAWRRSKKKKERKSDKKTRENVIVLLLCVYPFRDSLSSQGNNLQLEDV